MISNKFKKFLSSESRMSLREAKRICENAGYNVRFNESEYTVQPKTKEELKEIIKETIKEQGYECDLNFIDTSLITDMSELFKGSKFNGNISKWNTSNVTDMSWMFWKAKSFNQPIGDWDVSNVEDMSYMFRGATVFNQSLDKWDVSKVKLTRMDRIFKDSPLEENPPRWCKGEYLNEARKAQKLSKGDYVGCFESLYAGIWRGIIVEDHVYYWHVWIGDEAEQGLQASINAYKHNPKQAKRVEKEWLGPSDKFKIVYGNADVYKFGSLEKANEWVDKIVERGYL